MNSIKSTIARVIYLFGMLILLESCIEDFELDTAAPDAQLVVDGFISTGPGPFFITLSSTSDLTGVSNNFLGRGATLGVFDDEFNAFVFTEISPGVYSSEGSGLQGQVGRAYALVINLSNGKNYQSTWQAIPEPVSVQGLDTELIEENVQLDEFTAETRKYHQVLLDVENAEAAQFFKVENEGYDSVNIEFPIFFFDDPCPEKQFSCWRYVELNPRPFIGTNQFSTGNTFNFEAPSVPLNGPGDFAGKVKIFGMTADSYSFWTKISDQLDLGGTMFDPPFQPIIGNISNPDEEVQPLGFFHAYALTEVPYCIERSNLNVPINTPVGCICEFEYPDAQANLPSDLQFCRSN